MLKSALKSLSSGLRWWVPVLLVQGSLLSAAQLAVSTVNAGVGTTANITVSLTNMGSTVVGLQFDLQYDHTALSITGATAGSAATMAGKMLLGPSDEPDGSKTFGVAGINTTPIGDGSVVEISIKVSPTAFKGVYTLTMLNASGTDSTAHNVSITTVNGSIKVPDGPVAPALAITKTHAGNADDPSSGQRDGGSPRNRR
jgi:hypothetical protein